MLFRSVIYKLVQSGFVDNSQMKQALIESRKSGRPLIEVIESIAGRQLSPELLREYKKQQLFELKILYGLLATFLFVRFALDRKYLLLFLFAALLMVMSLERKGWFAFILTAGPILLILYRSFRYRQRVLRIGPHLAFQIRDKPRQHHAEGDFLAFIPADAGNNGNDLPPAVLVAEYRRTGRAKSHVAIHQDHTLVVIEHTADGLPGGQFRATAPI